MALNAPSAAPEASSEVLDAARTEQTPAPDDAALRALEKQREGAKVESATQTETLAQEVLGQVTVPGATPEDVVDAAEDAANTSGGWGMLSGLSEFFTKISTKLGDMGKKFGEWLGELMGIKPKDKDTEDETAAATADDEPEISTEMPDEDMLTPEDATGLLTVNSWDEVSTIVDLPTRVLQAALYANASGMDCFTKDKKGKLQNHCSGWCDSVFKKAGLDLYDESSRIYCDYENWPKKGSLQGLELQAGDSIIRYNGNASTGNHQEIIISSEGPDADGNYQILTVGQTSAKGTTGTRKVRSMEIKSKDIKAVIRPGATEPFEGSEPSLT